MLYSLLIVTADTGKSAIVFVNGNSSHSTSIDAIKCFYSALMIRKNKLECFSLAFAVEVKAQQV
jgi:hypothetical protein